MRDHTSTLHTLPPSGGCSMNLLRRHHCSIFPWRFSVLPKTIVALNRLGHRFKSQYSNSFFTWRWCTLPLQVAVLTNGETLRSRMPFLLRPERHGRCQSPHAGGRPPTYLSRRLKSPRPCGDMAAANRATGCPVMSVSKGSITKQFGQSDFRLTRGKMLPSALFRIHCHHVLLFIYRRSHQDLPPERGKNQEYAAIRQQNPLPNRS